MSTVNFVFFGTPEPAAEILDILLLRGLAPALIVTNPDRPQGRKMVLTPPPVKRWALANNIPCLQPEKPSEPEFLRQLSKVNCDVFIVVAYGTILPKTLLDIPKRGSLNVHYSLLPKYRGASPVESQILADDRDAGVSILLLDEKMDHGPIIAQRAMKFPISNFQFPSKAPSTNYQKGEKLDWPPKAEELRSAMNEAAGTALAEIMPDWIAGKIEAKPQDHSKATYTKKFTKADCEIDLSAEPYANFLKIQALGAWGPYFFAALPPSSPLKRGGAEGRGVRVKITSAEFKNEKLNILRVVPEGKKEMSYEEFLRGLK